MKNFDRIVRGVWSSRDPRRGERDDRLIRRCAERGLLSAEAADRLIELRLERELDGRPVSAEELLSGEGKLPAEKIQDIAADVEAAKPPELLAPGTGLGRYRVIREVARGGMGVVFEAEDADLGRRVALKVLRPGDADPVLVQRLHREAAIAAKLRHPNIVAIHEVGVAPGPDGAPVHFICMDLVEGRTFAQVLREAGPLAERLRILSDVAGAVAYAHSQGVIHRDLKPSNVLIERGGRVALTDFGLARSEGFSTALTRTSAVMGTPQYMAPEQVRGDTAAISPRSDVWALGVMLYESLTGRHPFEGGSAMEVYHRVMLDEPRTPRALDRAIPADAEIVCLQALEKDAERRYASAKEFADDLARVRQGEPVAARRPSPWRRLRRRMARLPMRAGLALGVAASILLIGSVGLPWVLRRESVRRMDADLQRLSDAIRAARPMFYVAAPHDFRDKMDEVQRALASLDELSRVPALEGRVEIWTALGTGAYFLGDAALAERCLLRSRDLQPDNAEADACLARIYLDLRMIEASLTARHPGTGKKPIQVTDLHRKAVAVFERFRASGAGTNELERLAMEARHAVLDGRTAEAIRLCEEGTARFRDSIGREEFWFLLGYVTQGEQRLRALAEALKVKPQFAMVHFMLATEQNAVSDWVGAIASCDAAIVANPRLASAYSIRAAAKSSVGRFREALDDANRALDLDPDYRHQRLIVRGGARQGLGDLGGALADFDEALRLCPDSEMALFHRGGLFLDQRRFDLALENWSRAIEVNPVWDPPRVRRGLLLRDLGRIDEAIRDFDEALRSNTRDGSIFIYRGIARHSKQDYDGALEDYDRGIQLAPSSAAGYSWRGLLHLVRKENAAALRDLDKAQALDPRNIGIYLNRSSAHLAAGDTAGALADAQASIDLDPKAPGAHYARAQALMARGDREGAMAALTETLRLAPGSWPYRAEAERILAELRSH